MSARIHKDDVEALVTVLDQEFETEADLVRTMWEAVQARLSLRSGFLVDIRYQGTEVVYGPFYGLPEANRAMAKWISAVGADTYGFVQPVTSVHLMTPKET